MNALLADAISKPESKVECLNPHAILSKFDLASRFSKGKKRRMPGPDHLPDSLFAAAPAAMAEFFHPLVVKMAMRIQKPIQLKGGVMVDLYKGKGSASNCKNSRGILISDALGKHLQKTDSDSVKDAYDRYVPENQCGNIGTEYATHIVREFQRWARANGLSSLILFMDLISAFYSVIRQLVIGLNCSDEDIFKLMALLNLPASAGQEFIQKLKQDSIFVTLGVDSHVHAIIEEDHQGTWFATNKLPNVTRTYRGSRPGIPFGNMLFCFLFESCFKKVRVALKQADLTTSLTFIQPWNGFEGPYPTHAVDVSDVEFVDDGAIMSAGAACDMVTKAQSIVGIVTHAMFGAFLEMNFGPLKTAALFTFVGKGAAAAKHNLHNINNGVFQAPGANGNQDVEAVCKYQHLGSIISDRISHAPEAAHRSRKAKAAFFPLRATVFGNPRVDQEPKILILSSLVTQGRLLFAVHTWPREDPGAMKTLGVAHMRMLKCIAGRSKQFLYDGKLTDRDICSSLNVPSVTILARKQRLLYLRRVLVHGPKQLLALIRANAGLASSWYATICDDLKWMQKLVPAVASLPDPNDDFFKWSNFIYSSKKEPWKYKVACAMKAHLGVERAAWARRSFLNSFWRHVGARGFEVPCGFAPAPPEDAAPPVFCAQCGLRCRNTRGLRVHISTKHGLKGGTAAYVHSNTCPTCLKFFHTRPRTAHHMVHDSPRCIMAAVQLGSPLSGSELDECAAESKAQNVNLKAQGLLALTATKPAFRVAGPLRLPPPIVCDGRDACLAWLRGWKARTVDCQEQVFHVDDDDIHDGAERGLGAVVEVEGGTELGTVPALLYSLLAEDAAAACDGGASAAGCLAEALSNSLRRQRACAGVAVVP